MKRVNLLVAGLVLFLAGTAASAAPVVSVGHVYAPLNGTLSFQLTVSDAGNAAAEDIEGMLLTLQIADGTGTTPKVQSIDMLTGTIWTGHGSSAIVPDGGNEPQFASRSIITDAFGDYVNANGVTPSARRRMRTGGGRSFPQVVHDRDHAPRVADGLVDAAVVLVGQLLVTA
ncbi:MAG: hypothetical protein ACHRHE_00065 [Tepidisphaerales bacterium]